MGRSRHRGLRRGRGSRLAAVGSRSANSVRSQASTRPNIRMEPTRGHDVMLDLPDDLAEILVNASKDRPVAV